MESLSEYIPLLLIVGSIIVSAISGSRKKKKEGTLHETRIPGVNPAKPVDSSYDSISEIEAGNEKQPEAKKPIITKKELNVNQKSRPRYSSQASVPGETDKTPTAEDEYAKPYMDASDLDEVKKAVIYSEIFSRKDY